ncbi:MAG: hypothetical protein HKM98_02490 [Gammaproteobacteria bacterium]|nr:hypothetical protein [Gammaproteobacteria bacterium]
MANEAYITNGTALLFNGEVGADVALSAEAVADGAGRVSAQRDLGAAPREFMFSWSCECQWQATPTQYGVLEIYVAGAPDSDSTQIDGDVGASDAALGDVDMRRNLKFIGRVVSENAVASEVCVNSGVFTHYQRYLSIVVFNAGGATLNATDSNFRFDLTPKAIQGQ